MTFLQIVLLLVAGGIAGYAAVQAIKERNVPPRRRPDSAVPTRPDALAPSACGGCPGPIGRSSQTFDINGDNRLDRRSGRQPGSRCGTRVRAADSAAVADSAAAASARGRRRPACGWLPATSARIPGLLSTICEILRTVFLTFERGDWEQELAAFYGTDVEVPATVVVDGTTYRDVGVHFRGNSSYRMVPAGYKHSLNLSFDFVNPDQQLGGYRTLNLINANDDATFVRTVLYSEIARNYLPDPADQLRAGRDQRRELGRVQNVQQFNKDFLRDWFNSTNGRALEGARQPARTGGPRVPGRRTPRPTKRSTRSRPRTTRSRGRRSSTSAAC